MAGIRLALQSSRAVLKSIEFQNPVEQRFGLVRNAALWQLLGKENYLGKSVPPGSVPDRHNTPPTRSMLKMDKQESEDLPTRKKPSVHTTDNCRDNCHFLKLVPLKMNRSVI